MFGWINDCTEKLVISKFGVENWHLIKQQAGCTIEDGGFIRHEYYPDDSTVQLVVAASNVLGLTVAQVLEAFGVFFMEFTRAAGYENLLSCMGNTLRSWLSNMNALHDHLESSLPRGMVKPVFWCEDDEDQEGVLVLHYYSKRGNLLVPVVIGVVKEVSRYHFDVDIEMELLQTQNEDGATHTSWKVRATDPSESWKITIKESQAAATDEPTPDFMDSLPGAFQCPFTGVMYNKSASSGSSIQETSNLDDEEDSSDDDPAEEEEKEAEEQEEAPHGCPYHHHQSNPIASNGSPVNETPLTNGTKGKAALLLREMQQQQQPKKRQHKEPSISGRQMKKIFPYHIVVDNMFEIIQVGASLPHLMEQTKEDFFLGKHIKELFVISKPIMGSWDWKTLKKLEDQTFFVDPVEFSLHHVKLKANIVRISDPGEEFQVMFVLSPDVKNVQELSAMQLTMSDLPLHSFQRDAVFLGEHIVSEVQSAHKLEKLSRKLMHEEKLSNALLYSLLPPHVADELRSGKTVQPELHEEATLFFSDIVGFTQICDSIFPWDCVDLLNRLYCVMDYLAQTFDLYKIETIGDSYLCGSGLPTADPRHAQNVANFAVAVSHCSQLVINPVDGRPIQLRIGIHSGSVMTGVVGMKTPRYCVFGDTVNTASRHESTGVPGKIQCSSITYGQLQHFCDQQEFVFTPRGLVDMKGKGTMATYFLDGGSEHNPDISPRALDQLRNDVEEVLKTKKFSNKRYFKRYGRRSSETCFGGSTTSTYSDYSESQASLSDFQTDLSGEVDPEDSSSHLRDDLQLEEALTKETTAI